MYSIQLELVFDSSESVKLLLISEIQSNKTLRCRTSEEGKRTETNPGNCKLFAFIEKEEYRQKGHKFRAKTNNENESLTRNEQKKNAP